ncbi:unnamed protein product [Amoebophrya sp. A25]|nr:unnamed protein product [Amoebophrya sp. A25]|eukprot:GSA25T00025243001.1
MMPPKLGSYNLHDALGERDAEALRDRRSQASHKLGSMTIGLPNGFFPGHQNSRYVPIQVEQEKSTGSPGVVTRGAQLVGAKNGGDLLASRRKSCALQPGAFTAPAMIRISHVPHDDDEEEQMLQQAKAGCKNDALQQIGGSVSKLVQADGETPRAARSGGGNSNEQQPSDRRKSTYSTLSGAPKMKILSIGHSTLGIPGGYLFQASKVHHISTEGHWNSAHPDALQPHPEEDGKYIHTRLHTRDAHLGGGEGSQKMPTGPASSSPEVLQRGVSKIRVQHHHATATHLVLPKRGTETSFLCG